MTRARKGRILVYTNSIGGKPIDPSNLADGTVIVYDQTNYGYKYVDPAMLFGVTDITYANLVTAINAGTLSPGRSYRITDYQTKHYIYNGDGDVALNGGVEAVNTGPVEPIIVFAVTTSSIAKEAYSETYPQDIIWYDWDPANWKYDLTVAAWNEVPVTGWKGIIYQRHDTKNNVLVGCDFRNMKFRRWKLKASKFPVYNAGTSYSFGNTVTYDDGTFIRTYVSTSDNNMGNLPSASNSVYWTILLDITNTEYVVGFYWDANSEQEFEDVYMFHDTVAGEHEFAYEQNVVNFYNPFVLDNTDIWLYYGTYVPNNVFYLKSTLSAKYPNIKIDGVVQNNTFLESCYNVVIKPMCTDNIFSFLMEMTLGTGSFGNIANELTACVTGDGFSLNKIGPSCNLNSFGTGFYNNIVGHGFIENVVGNGVSTNKFCRNVKKNTFGSNIFNNKFTAASNSYEISSNVFESFNSYMNFHCSSASMRFNTFKPGVGGTYSAPLDFTGSTLLFATCPVTFTKASSGALKALYVKEATGIFTNEITNYNA